VCNLAVSHRPHLRGFQRNPSMSLTSQRLRSLAPARLNRYPRGFTGHVAHSSRSIAERKEIQVRSDPPQPKLYLWVMTTQEKVAAIKEIVSYHDDNLAAVKAANLKPGLDAVVTDAMNNALKDDLSLVFALKPPKALG
jgi:hypothetical protein